VSAFAAWLTQEKFVRTIDAEKRVKETPLQRAAEIGSGAIFEILLSAGADLNKKDHRCGQRCRTTKLFSRSPKGAKSKKRKKGA
jgi:hypothetical protein